MSHYERNLSLFILLILFTMPSFAWASSDPRSRTESICNLGMVKGEATKSCQVPIPAGCQVAQFPGYDEPWVDASKGGGTSCQFDEKKTDWKTNITGTCQQCTTEQCSGRFSVMFNCSDNIPPANPMPIDR